VLIPWGAGTLAHRRRRDGHPPWRLLALPVCASTELELSRWLERTSWDGRQPRAVVATRQTHGKGQWGRHWQAPAGGVWLSAALPWPADRAAPGLLGLALALALAERLEAMALPVKIKWPNDLLMDGRKLAGVLPRMVHRGSCLRLARIGVGLNVANPVPAGAIALKERLTPGRCRPRFWTGEVLLALDRAIGLAREPEVLLRGVEARLWSSQVPDPAGGEPWDVQGLAADGALLLRQGTRTTSWTRWADDPVHGL